MLREKFGELFCFLLRKSLTCCRTSQLQGKVVPTTADEGVAVFEFIEEVGYEAFSDGALPGAIVSFVSASVTFVPTSVTFVTLSAGISKAIAPGL